MISFSRLISDVSSRRRPVARCRPSLDVLEARQLLSTLVVTTTDDDGPGSLRAEVAAADSGDTITFDPSLDGKTILLTSGPVAEVGKSLTIAGPGADQLTISGGGSVSIFRFSADPSVFGSSIDVTVSGLTLANGSAPVNGGAIAAQDANLTLSDDVILNNIAGSFGGGVDMGFATNFNTLTLTVTGTRFEGNSSPFGGGIQSTGFTSNVSGSTFINNTSSGNFGGAAVLGYGAATVSDSTFTGNSGGALAFFAGFNPGSDIFHVSGSTFDQNTTTGIGGAAINSFGLLTIDGSTFRENVTTNDPSLESYSLGGAIHSQGDTSITGSQFIGNRNQGPGATSGGAVYIIGGYTSGGSTNRIIDSTFSDNQSVSSQNASGGAVYWDAFNGSQPTDTFTVSGSTFENNSAVGLSSATSYGGLATAGALFIGGYGGAITIDKSAFRGNLALGGDSGGAIVGGTAWAGAVYASGYSIFAPYPSLTISDTSFEENQARSGSGTAGGGLAEGGALYTISSVPFPTTITGSSFVGNSSISGPGGRNGNAVVFADGGAIRNGAELNVDRTAFIGNTVVGSAGAQGRDGGEAQGGAVWSAWGTISNSLFLGNSAVGGSGGDAVGTGTGGHGGNGIGGAVQTYGDLTVNSSAFLRNDALGGRGGKGRGAGVGGAGGDGIGGSIALTNTDPAATLVVLDSVLSMNDAIGGMGGPGKNAGADGQGLGGGIAILGGSATIKRTKFFKNRASTAGNDVYGTYTS